VQGGEQHGDSPRLERGHDDGLLGTGGIKDRAKVLRPLLPCGNDVARYGAGGACSPAVEDDDPAERRYLPPHLDRRRELPDEVDVAAETVTVEKVGRSLAEHLVGDVGVANRDVTSFGTLHRRQSGAVTQVVAGKPSQRANAVYRPTSRLRPAYPVVPA